MALISSLISSGSRRGCLGVRVRAVGCAREWWIARELCTRAVRESTAKNPNQRSPPSPCLSRVARAWISNKPSKIPPGE
eukprot:1597348-Prymnesium_polylepis.1